MADHIPSTSSIEALSVRQFDYIVVGGGIGGLVVARRLSDDATKTVLLIEAGANRTGDARIDTPGFLGTLYGDPNYDWDYISEPQVRCPGSPNKIVPRAGASNRGCAETCQWEADPTTTR